MNQKPPSIIILYHFFYPDDVVSARHFSQFAEELRKRNWDVTVLTSNRFCRYPKRKIDKKFEVWQGIKIFRIYRPGWNQANRYLRLANSLWMIIGWFFKLLSIPRADVIVIGSDPPFSAILFPPLHFFRRAKVFAHWCFDLFPEATIVERESKVSKWLGERVKFFMRFAYRYLDLIVDLGSCMRKRLSFYRYNAQSITLVPWALVEADQIQGIDVNARRELFSDAKLALLYSGNMGKAHSFSLFIKLARILRDKKPKIVINFACRGNKVDELKKAVNPSDKNIRFADFADESHLKERLSSADIHLLSMMPGWEGVVVPSKFFGSLAVGRPVLYAGPEGSAIVDWIRKFKVGLVLTDNNINEIADELLNIANNPDILDVWKKNAFESYQENFSKSYVMDQWDKVLKEILMSKISSV